MVGVIKEEAYELRIKELCGDWAKVDYNGTIGWIKASWLCGNPLATCSQILTIKFEILTTSRYFP